MLDSRNWITVKWLDQIDITSDPAAEAEHLRGRLPALREALQHATQWVADTLAPVPINHPAFDDWDDNYWMAKAMGQSRYGEKHRAVQEAEQRLDELASSDDPGRKVAGFLLIDIHRHLKDLGLGDGQARQASTPRSIAALPLAEVLWQARNQDQHFNETGPLQARVLDCFRAILDVAPTALGQSIPPPDDHTLQALLHQHSWAPEVLQLLGWTTSQNAAAGISSIQP